jgi:hypothetical protein
MANCGMSGRSQGSSLRALVRRGRRALVDGVKRLLYWKWVLQVRTCRAVSVPSASKVTVVLTAYKKERMRNLDPLVRSVLKCRFVEKVIVSNDNPDLRIADWVMVHDERLVLLDQPARRGCKHRWELAQAENAAYTIAIDDDVLIHPKQLALLFTHLLDRQEVPHGLSGCKIPFEFHERQELEVDLLFEIYAVTREHVQAYFDTIEQLKARGTLPAEGLGKRGDFVVISHSGKARPVIHDVGFIARCASAYAEGVATFKEDGFASYTGELLAAVRKIETLRRLPMGETLDL